MMFVATKTIRVCISSVIIWILLILTVVPFFLILFTIRFLSSKLVPLVHPDISKIVTTLSSFFASQEGESRTTGVYCFGLEGDVKLEDLRATFESRVIQKKSGTGHLQWPEFQQYTVHKLGFPFWKWDKSFNIKNHFHTLEIASELHAAGPNPQDVLDAIEEKVIHKPFPVTQSPWEIYHVPNFKDTPLYGKGTDAGCEGTMLLFHVDHVLGDGAAVASVFQEVFNGEKTVSKPVGSRSVGYCASALNKLKIYFFGPHKLITTGMLASNYGWKPNSKINKYNAAVSPTIPVEMFKNMRTNYNANFSAVAILLIGRALYKFMREAGYELPEAVLCALPRAADSQPHTKLRNRVTFATFKLPMKLEAKELVEAVQASLAVSIESRVPETNFVVGKMIGGLWKAFHRTLISSDGSGDILFSNIKFYEDAQFFKNTNKLRTIMGRARMATGGNGIVVVGFGCREGVRFLFQIDEGIVPRNQLHAKVFIKYFIEELHAISQSKSPNSDSV